MESFLRTKVERWRGKPPRRQGGVVDEDINPNDGKEGSGLSETELTLFGEC